jgi:hypothetical protein
MIRSDGVKGESGLQHDNHFLTKIAHFKPFTLTFILCLKGEEGKRRGTVIIYSPFTVFTASRNEKF